MLRQIYPELVRRSDDNSNDVRIANAASATALVQHCLQPGNCDTNTVCASWLLWWGQLCFPRPRQCLA
jgi:hypothetical protein